MSVYFGGTFIYLFSFESAAERRERGSTESMKRTTGSTDSTMVEVKTRGGVQKMGEIDDLGGYLTSRLTSESYLGTAAEQPFFVKT